MTQSPAMRDYRQAVERTRAKDYLSASAYLGDAIQADPSLPDSYFLLARIHLESGRFEEAAGLLEPLHERYPRDREIGLALVEADRKIGERARAAAVLERLSVLQHGDERVNLELARLWSEMGRHRRAGRCLERLLRQRPECAEAWLLLGEVYLSARRPRKAEQAFSRCLALDPEHRAAKRGLGRALVGGARPATTGEDEGRERELEQLRDQATRQAADSDLEAAITTLTAAYRLAPDNYDLLFEIALLYRQRGMEDRCGEILQELVVQAPDNPLYQFHLGVWEAARNRLEEAARLLERAVELDPFYAEAIHELGVCHQKLKRPAQAEGFFLRSLEMSGGDAATYFHLAQVQFQQGREEQSLETLAGCVERFPAFYEARLALANFLRLLGRWDEALEHLDAVLANDPGHLAARRARAQVLSQTGDVEAARRAWLGLAEDGDGEALLRLESLSPAGSRET